MSNDELFNHIKSLYSLLQREEIIPENPTAYFVVTRNTGGVLRILGYIIPGQPVFMIAQEGYNVLDEAGEIGITEFSQL